MVIPSLLIKEDVKGHDHPSPKRTLHFSFCVEKCHFRRK